MTTLSLKGKRFTGSKDLNRLPETFRNLSRNGYEITGFVELRNLQEIMLYLDLSNNRLTGRFICRICRKQL